MKKFYECFCDSESKLRQAVAVLPWGHTLTLMRKFGDDDKAMLYSINYDATELIVMLDRFDSFSLADNFLRLPFLYHIYKFRVARSY